MSDLTIFILTTGEETFDECIEAIKKQELAGIGEPYIDIIKDVFPVYEAFNQMHIRAKTPYFIQVDADVVLDNSDAVRTLYEAIRKRSFFVYAAYGQLYEEGFGPGGSVRCWKKGIFKIFKFRDIRATDRDFYRRAMLLGFHRINVNKVLGTHRPRQSDLLDYWKTKGDVEKWQFLKRPFDRYALGLYTNLVTAPQKNSYKILGFLLGVLTSKERIERSKDTKVERERIYHIFNTLGIDFGRLDLRSSTDFSYLLGIARRAYLNYSKDKKSDSSNRIFKELFGQGLDRAKLDRLYQSITY